jgi:eukaryotic-like serine/threonine-protein kinase
MGLSSPLLGRTVGHYRVLEQIGAGGMGIVCRARDQRLERDVAIKVLAPGLLVEEGARKRFRKEALALAKLNHPNIAAIYDVGELDGLDYLVMEFVPGETLADKLRAGPLALPDALAIGCDVAAALEEAHEQGVVHRDLKPGNIAVTPKGRAKVLDFGVAKLLAHTDPDITQSVGETRFPVGTLAYMSPEQAEGKPLDSRTDLWSLGVVLYESLSGRAPFHGDSSLAILRSVTQDIPKPLREIRPDTPRDTEEIVSRAMEKSPGKRYQSAADMSRDLSAVLARLTTPSAPGTEREVKVPRVLATAALLMFALLIAGGAWFYHRSEKKQWAREQAIPQIAELKQQDKPLAAFRLLHEAQRYLPGDPQLAEIAGKLMELVSITSSPAGATVEIQDYLSPDSSWYPLGTTPLKEVRIPSGYFRWKLSKPGLRDYVAAPQTQKQMNFSLDMADHAPRGMVFVDGGNWFDFIGFVGWVGPYRLPPYYLDQYEVTNREYQEFVDQGGYRNREYWKEKFLQNGRELSWEEAMALLRDRTDRPGPSTWEGGHYPEGKGEYPVSGLSWYEAAAYAKFAGKSLPALAQWFKAAPPEVANYTVRTSNIALQGLVPVGAFKGLGPYGTYDMAGNVREWVANPTGEQHYLLGGSWNSPTYIVVEPEALPSFDRSPFNGLRCVRNTSPLPNDVIADIKPLNRDFSKFKPVPDDVYRAYLSAYAYDKTPLNVKSEGVVHDTADWREEKVSFDTAYGDERMNAYLFVPKNVRPPYQTVVFFPSARVLDIASSDHLGDIKFFDYLVQSGRAVLYPVYQGTYERRSQFMLPGGAHETEIITQRYKDLARALDYLQTRSDVDKNNIAYLGVSMGSAEGVIYATLAQDRLKTVIFLDGGYFLVPEPAVIDQANFASRLKKPVLMINGRYDFSFPVEKSQLPLFHMLGSPEADKKDVLLDTPHDVTERRSEMVPVVLDWLDKYLGRVE